MKGVGSYVLFVVILVAVVVVIALVVHLFADVEDRRSRYRERLADLTPADPGMRPRGGFPLRLWIMILCLVASIGALFAVAAHTVAERDDQQTWLGFMVQPSPARGSGHDAVKLTGMDAPAAYAGS